MSGVVSDGDNQNEKSRDAKHIFVLGGVMSDGQRESSSQ